MITLWITYKTWSHPLSQSEPSILMLHIPLRKWLHANPERVFSPRPARSAGRRPEGEGANLDRRLVPYHGKCKRIQSRIEPSSCTVWGILVLVNSLQQKLIWIIYGKPTVVIAKWNLKWYYSFFFSKRNIIFFMKKERKLVNKTTLYNYGYRKSRIAEE